jgi:hypothetical protein
MLPLASGLRLNVKALRYRPSRSAIQIEAQDAVPEAKCECHTTSARLPCLMYSLTALSCHSGSPVRTLGAIIEM